MTSKIRAVQVCAMTSTLCSAAGNAEEGLLETDAEAGSEARRRRGWGMGAESKVVLRGRDWPAALVKPL